MGPPLDPGGCHSCSAHLAWAGGPPPRPGMSPSSDPASNSDSIAAGLCPLAASCMAWSAPFGLALPSAARSGSPMPGREAPGPAGDWKSRLNCGRCGKSDLHSSPSAVNRLTRKKERKMNPGLKLGRCRTEQSSSV